MISNKNIKAYTGVELRERIRLNARPVGIMYAYKQATPRSASNFIPIKNRLGSVEPIICQVVNYHAKGSILRTKAVVEVITAQMSTQYVNIYEIDGFIELTPSQMKTLLTMPHADQFNQVTKLFTHSKLHTYIEERNKTLSKRTKKREDGEREFMRQLESQANPSVEKSVLQTLQNLREEMLDRIERLGVQVARLSVSIGELQAETALQTKEVQTLTAPLVKDASPTDSEFKNLPPVVKKMRIHDLIIQAKELQRRMDDIEAHKQKRTSVETA